ncbi:hypothetical protein ROZALSC1DRAFT_26751 [Rozella allomycis CSF55]|uniref:Phosphotransferase n=1 Tax=Rozella allomycis (strain CSF55) TaxID=988480 RepID=A0A4P9YRW2_ROZAC|nr:hypothetical protein ROZALSC1DRAFT_26751 [Rozella allomycis CSF55]
MRSNVTTFLIGAILGAGLRDLLRNLSLNYKSDDEEPIYVELESQFILSPDILYAILKKFTECMSNGLAEENYKDMPMIPSFVERLPKGNETGYFLAIDLGGTNARICLVDLKGTREQPVLIQKKAVVPDDVKAGKSEDLFNWLADLTFEFIKENEITNEEKIKLGFTFSFPVVQSGLSKGKLTQWAKGFSCEGVVGKDVVEPLQKALHNKGLEIEVVALVNDTVGTLVSHSYVDEMTFMGVILGILILNVSKGTGTNAAYVEECSRIKKKDLKGKQMVINTEWGAFDSERKYLPYTKYDNQLNKESLYPNQQNFEKMISGMYLGEITRHVLVDLHARGLLFPASNINCLLKRESFLTSQMSRIERDNSKNLDDVKIVLEKNIGISETDLNDRKLVKHVCKCVGTRAAQLSAMAIGAVLKHSGRWDSTVAIDGSLFEHYPNFKLRIQQTLRQLFGVVSDDVKLSLANDGSGIGAALIAASC